MAERGQTTVETALLLPVVLLLLACLVHAGLLGVDEVRLWHAAREGARAAAVTADRSAIEHAVGRSSPEGTELRVTPPASQRSAGQPVTVTLAYRPTWVIPVVDSLLGIDRLTADTTMRIETP